MSGLTNSSAKVLAIIGLAIGISAISFAKGGSTSIVTQLNNANASDNTAVTVDSLKGGTSGGHGGNSGGHSGGNSGGGHSGGNSGGGHSGGNSGGGNGGPPECVPEPFSMLALGIGSGIVLLKKRAKKA